MTDLAGKYKNDPSMRAVSLGLDVAHFVEHDKVGQYLVEKAHSCRIEALEGLATADPTDARTMIKLQWEARIPDMFLAWLDEAIANGRAQEEIILIEESSGNV